jgi:hypothetical protein
MKMPRYELGSGQLPNHRSRCDVHIGGQLQNVLQKTKAPNFKPKKGTGNLASAWEGR